MIYLLFTVSSICIDIMHGKLDCTNVRVKGKAANNCILIIANHTVLPFFLFINILPFCKGKNSQEKDLTIVLHIIFSTSLRMNFQRACKRSESPYGISHGYFIIIPNEPSSHLSWNASKYNQRNVSKHFIFFRFSYLLWFFFMCCPFFCLALWK